jgi:uncharacterized protein (DUF934 family)
MQIIKNRRLAQNHWRYDYLLGEINLLPDSIISYQDWRTLSQTQAVKCQGIAIFPEDVVDYADTKLLQLQIINIIFPSFNEGRGYTQAKRLRNHGYEGELRAIGAYQDNLLLMEQVGFNAFDLAKSENIDKALGAFSELCIAFAQPYYQRPI